MSTTASAPSGEREVRNFLRSLPRLIDGLTLSIVESAEEANYRIFIVDRMAYRTVVTEEVYGRPSSSFAPGRCLVRVVSNRNGIERSDAVIVADEGDFLFRRCMVEEILQGLGPVNDDASLSESVFNDSIAARDLHALRPGDPQHALPPGDPAGHDQGRGAARAPRGRGGGECAARLICGTGGEPCLTILSGDTPK